MKGKVYLVGAGPGDPGLLTVKADRLLRSADLIVYDYLANPRHLDRARTDAARICVGKRYRHQVYTQEKINRLILKAAKAGRQVVRLKGGDPYLFGRGGEEALFLQKHGVAFEVVPGVTSATACAAYAGVPLTHRDHNASVTFLTGHRAGDENLDSIDWQKVVSLGGTLVIYMGFYNLAVIARRLRESGMRSDAKVCVIEWGTLPRQKTCEGTLASIAGHVKRAGLGAPCIILVGDVVSLRGRLAWYERLPLFGKTVVVTRAEASNAKLTEKLSELGAEVVACPTIEIRPLASTAALDRALKDLSVLNWAVFTSPHGVRAVFGRLTARHADARAFAGVKIACIGPGTAEALALHGLQADLVPDYYFTDGLVRALKARGVRGQTIGLFRTDIAPEALEKGLRALGAAVRTVVAYRTRRPRGVPEAAARALKKGSAHCVTFTSASTFENFIRLLGRPAAQRLARRSAFVSIGPVTTQTMRRFGFKPRKQAAVHDIDGLVKAVRESV